MPSSRNFSVSGIEYSTWLQRAHLWSGERAPGIKLWRSHYPDQELPGLSRYEVLGPRWCWPHLLLRKKLDWAYV